MAIVTCPGCGKNVSDTNGKCFNCGVNLTQKNKPSEVIDYNRLDGLKRKELRDEFNGGQAGYNKLNENIKRLSVSMYVLYALIIVCVIGFVVFTVISRITIRNNVASNGVSGSAESSVAVAQSVAWMGVVMIIFLVVEAISLLAYVYLRFVVDRKYKKKLLIYEKRFQKWLIDVKGIKYVVPFTAKQKRDKAFFDQINVDKDEV